MKNMKIQSWFSFTLLIAMLLNLSCAHQQTPADTSRTLASQNTAAIDYPSLFQTAREVLKLNSDTSRRSKKSANEMDIIEALQKDSQLLSADKETLLKVVEQESKTNVDPTKHLRLTPPAGQWGYEDLKYYSNHPFYFESKLIQASNLVQVWKTLIEQAQKQIILNVFDFDLKEIADVLAKKSRAGVKVTVGIDEKTAKDRPAVAEVVRLLQSANVNVNLVNSVSLNHQKMMAIDWDDIKKAQVLFSSGNLTQSCLGPEGDLPEIPEALRPPESVPNANHLITMKSWLAAQLIFHELTKTMGADFHYRGSQYPTTGSFQITGPGVDPSTLEAYPENSFIISFSPGGGYRNINRNLIGHFIKNSEGPIRMLQFAYSSKEVSEALLTRATKSFSTSGNFDFVSVGDTPFAMQFWSQFLKMSGLKLQKSESEKKYVEDPNSWTQALTPEQMQKLRSKVRIAPKNYGNFTKVIQGKSYPVSAKIHHKVLVTGPYAIVGTSFNFSEGAESNNEQILIFKNKDLVRFANGMTQWLAQNSSASVYEEAQRRNRYRGKKEEAATQSNEDRL